MIMILHKWISKYNENSNLVINKIELMALMAQEVQVHVNDIKNEELHHERIHLDVVNHSSKHYYRILHTIKHKFIIFCLPN